MCGCSDKSGPKIPMTSGDLAEGDGRFLVHLDSGATHDFDTYAEAAAYKRAFGGQLDVRR